MATVKFFILIDIAKLPSKWCISYILTNSAQKWFYPHTFCQCHLLSNLLIQISRKKKIFHYIGNIMNGIGLIMGKYEHISTYSKVFCASLSTSYLSIILPYFLLFLKLTLWKCNEPIVICLVSFFGLLFSLQFHFWLYQSLWYF